MKQTKNAIYMLIHSYSSLLTKAFIWGGASLLIINPAFADVKDTIEWSGGVDSAGNPAGTKDNPLPDPEPDRNPDKKNPYYYTSGTYNKIDFNIDRAYGGVRDTTEAWIVHDKLTVNDNGSVKIVNTVDHSNVDNNGTIRAMSNGIIDFTDLEQVYLVAVDGKESRNDSTAITVEGAGKVEVSGKTVQIIGSIDVKDANSESTVNMTLSGKDSFWYGSVIGDSSTKNSVDVTLKDGASWIFYKSGSLGSSWFGGGGGRLSNLTLDGGVVILDEDIIKSRYESTPIVGTDKTLSDYRTDEGKHSAVNITNLKGAGIFKIDLDWVTNQGKTSYTSNSDFINIT
ncbi:MAG: hypothetical protein Q4E81_05455, partial [Succinatimonas sp.]|nr:hypothetical protein [Succinatimonas sp.]